MNNDSWLHNKKNRVRTLNVLYIADTKNGEKREVSMNDYLTETLKSIKSNDTSPYVFCDDEGKPYYDFRKSFATALERAGIKDFRFHDLRHTFASNLVMGAHIWPQ